MTQKTTLLVSGILLVIGIAYWKMREPHYGKFVDGTLSNPESFMKSETLQDIQLSIGMDRAAAEELIARHLKTTSQYTPYRSDLATEETVTYSDGSVVLEVAYSPGTPAPWVINTEGVAEHYAPIDATVKSFRTYRIK